MGKIISVGNFTKASAKLKNQGKKIVLVGGCFDILHAGHLAFLKSAKQQGDILVVILESDETIRKIKGEKRPVHTQALRAKILESLETVDFVIQIPQLKSDRQYAQLVKKIEPDIIAVTKGDPMLNKKIAHAQSINGKVLEVIKRQKEHSTTDLIKTIE